MNRTELEEVEMKDLQDLWRKVNDILIKLESENANSVATQNGEPTK